MTKRVTMIDSLRGFSLFGILIANLLIFQYGQINDTYNQSFNLVDQISYYFTKIFVETSFIPIFTFIFGYALIKLFESIKRKQDKTRGPLIRRAIGLIVIGYLHSTYIWEGDILMFYGATLFILLFFLYRKPKTLIIWAIIFYALINLMLIGNSEDDLSFYDADKFPTYIELEKETMQNGSYLDVVDFRKNGELPIAEDFEWVIIVAFIMAPFMHLPMFLLGMAFAKLHKFENHEQEKNLYKSLALLIPLALILKSVSFVDTIFSDLLYGLGGPLLALGYIGLFALIYFFAHCKKWGLYFEAVGKISLTNYLLQSIIFTSIFYGYGLGLFNKIGPTLAIGIGLVVYSMQIVFSLWYTRKFKYGPIEYILRIWTNLKVPKKA